jgi:hypothetical protein
MSAKIFWTIVITGGLGGALAAQAQVGSPFAVKKKQQAWETPQAPALTAPHTSAPTAPYVSSRLPAAAPSQRPQAGYWPQSASHDANSFYKAPLAGSEAGRASISSAGSAPISSAQTYRAPSPQIAPATAAPRSPFAPRPTQTSAQPPAQPYENTPPQGYAGTYAETYAGTQNQFYPSQTPQAQTYQGQTYQGQAYQGQNTGYQQAALQRAAPKLRWQDRLGLGNIATSLKGFLKLGAAAVRRDGSGSEAEWDDSYIADGQIRGEVSAITEGGLEYGVGGLIRGQYDAFRRGFGGRIGDCPPDIAGCASVDIDGAATAIRGHSSRFYTAGPSDARETDIALEGAYLFLRSSYGDVSLGRDDGAAFLFSLGAPSLVAVNASNSPVDYTGLDSVKTVNDVSGFAEKITYVTPRLLGDRIGVGVQLGASYSPNARACGVDYCVRRNGADGTGVLAPELEDVAEFGVSLDRNFGNGLSAELTGTYARASERSNLLAFDDLESFGAGVEVKYNDITLGSSWLKSNNALANGDYEAWDIGLSWKPAQWGVSLSYGHADDDSVNLTSDQITLGGLYEFSDRFSLGTGVQYIDRRSPFVIGGLITEQDEKAYGLFLEGKVTF